MKGQRPDFIAYMTVETGRDKTHWKEVGVAFWNRNQESMTVRLNALPLSGKVILMPPKPRESPEEGVAAAETPSTSPSSAAAPPEDLPTDEGSS